MDYPVSLYLKNLKKRVSKRKNSPNSNSSNKRSRRSTKTKTSQVDRDAVVSSDIWALTSTTSHRVTFKWTIEKFSTYFLETGSKQYDESNEPEEEEIEFDYCDCFIRKYHDLATDIPLNQGTNNRPLVSPQFCAPTNSQLQFRLILRPLAKSSCCGIQYVALFLALDRSQFEDKNQEVRIKFTASVLNLNGEKCFTRGI